MNVSKKQNQLKEKENNSILKSKIYQGLNIKSFISKIELYKA